MEGASVGTFSAMEEKFVAQETTATTTPELSNTTVTPEGTTETPLPGTGSETNQSVVSEEENVSSFSVGGDSADIQTANEVATQSAGVPQTFNWKEEIKKIDPKELLKEVGVSDFAFELDQHIKGGGKAEDYLNAKAIDYNQISDEDIIKADIRRQYQSANQKLTSKQVDLLFERKYAFDETTSDDDRELLELQLKTDANNLRQQKITEQQKFKIADTPIPQKDEAYDEWKQQVSNQEKIRETAKNFYLNHEATKSLNESKRVAVSLGDGIKPFNFVIDKPEFITNSLTDGGETLSKLVTTKTGEPDVAKEQLITLFACNPQKFIQDIFNYGKTVAGIAKVAEGQNAVKPNMVVQPTTSTNGQVVSTGKLGDKDRY